MAEYVYEGMFILDSGRYGRNPEAVAGQVPEFIEKAGGSMLVSRLWEERRLAYAIKGHRKGTYWLSYFRLDSSKLAGVQRQCQLSDSILRVLFLKVDPRIVDALVAHADAGPAGASAAARLGKPEAEPKAETTAEPKAEAKTEAAVAAGAEGADKPAAETDDGNAG